MMRGQAPKYFFLEPPLAVWFGSSIACSWLGLYTSRTGHLSPACSFRRFARNVGFCCCAVVTSTLVRRPFNSAVVQGTTVTLQCSSDVSSSVLVWYNTLCVTTTSSIFYCRKDRVYTGYTVLDPFSSRFQVTAVNNATHVTRDLTINSTQLTDAGVYLCAEERPGVADVQSSSAQFIVLGNY